MQERRAFSRIPVKLGATYKLVQKSTVPRVAVADDLSLGGSHIYEAELLEPGWKISVALTLSSEGQVVLPGTVVWCRESRLKQGGYEAGIQWGEINPIFQARLKAFIAHRTPSCGPTISTLREPSPAFFPAEIIWGLLGCAIFILSLFLW